MLQVSTGDQTYQINEEDVSTVTGYKELVAIQRAFGKPLESLSELDQLGAVVWTLLKRQVPTVRIDDIDFDLTAVTIPATEEAAAPLDSNANATGT